jgi:hypothetical protein
VQNVSLDALPQLRLIPSIGSKLPIKGRWGDLYVNVSGDITDSNGTLSVNMYLCMQPGDGTPGNVPLWAPFTLGTPQPGGT